MTLAAQINARRLARGQEPMMLWHIERAIRFVQGHCAAQPQRETRYQAELRIRRAYIRAPRGRCV